MSARRPRCVVIAGPNGAGKSTIAPDLVHGVHGIGRYVNADTIAAGLAGFSPGAVDYRAGRIALDTISGYMAEGVDFAFETTLSGRRWPRLLDELEERGYVVLLHYLWLPSPDLAVARVRFRVFRGGHSVPEGDVRRRYASSAQNLIQIWMVRVRAWQVLDAARLPGLVPIAEGERGRPPHVLDMELWARVETAGASPAGDEERNDLPT